MRRDFTSAQNFCHQRGGKLLKITNKMVKDYITCTYLGVFLVDAMKTEQNSGVFKWLDDDSTVDWHINHANSSFYDCVILFPSGGLYGTKCINAPSQVICEKRSIKADSGNGHLNSK